MVMWTTNKDVDKLPIQSFCPELWKWHYLHQKSNLMTFCAFYLQISIFSCLMNISGVVNSASDGENAHKLAENSYRQTKKSKTGTNFSKTKKNNNFLYKAGDFWYIFDSFCVHIHLEFYHEYWKELSIKLERCYNMYRTLNSRQG